MATKFELNEASLKELKTKIEPAIKVTVHRENTDLKYATIIENGEITAAYKLEPDEYVDTVIREIGDKES